jgi:hypothetical protein
MSEWRLATKSLRGPIWFYRYIGLPEMRIAHIDPRKRTPRVGPISVTADIEYLIDGSGAIKVRNVVPSRSEGSGLEACNAATSYGMAFVITDSIPPEVWRPVVARELETNDTFAGLLRTKWGHVARWRGMQPTDDPACESTMRVMAALHADLPRQVTEAEARQIIDFLNAHIISCPFCKQRIACSEDICPCCGRGLEDVRVTIEIGG